MSRIPLQRAGLRALLTAVLLTSVFGLGSVAGIYFEHSADEHADEADVHAHGNETEVHGGLARDTRSGTVEDDEAEEEHVALTRQAYENLNLRMGTVCRGDYWKTMLVPGRVVEIPGRSNLSISASVTGIVEKVHVLPGQSLDPHEPLFTIRTTDQSLIDAQARLLDTLTRQKVATQELARLQPLTSTGAVSGSKARELEYELKQLRTQESTLLQELRSRGMSEVDVDEFLKSREMASLSEVVAPAVIGQAAPRQDGASGYSVENLVVHPGKSVNRGDLLCSVAYHLNLYIEGTAFPDDLSILERIAENSWKIRVDTQEPSSAHSHESPYSEPPSDLNLDLLRIGNHVDEDTQTVRFFLQLPNQATASRQSDGRTFEQWRFRPGQRLHLRLPVELWKNQLTLPRDAVVVDGANVLVFAKHMHDEPEQAMAGKPSATPVLHAEEDEHDAFLELEPVPVRLLYRDDQTVVIADDGQISGDTEIALNNAYKLYLAMKTQSEGGGGHHHHDH